MASEPVTTRPKTSSWDPDTMGFNKHDYRHLDPTTVNVDDYAKDLREGQTNFGDVREYNSAFNTKHPENDLELDWLGRIGTIFETEAEGYEGRWMVVQMPVVHSPALFARAARIDENDEPIDGTLKEIPFLALGCAVDKTNHFPQIKSHLVARGKVDRKQRERLTKR